MSTSSDPLVDRQVAGSPVPLPNDRTARISTFVVRIVVGLLWVENLSWKIPPHFGADDNSGLYNQTSLAVEYPVLAPFSAVIESVVLPNFAVFGWGVYIVEICLGLFLLLGLATRFWAVVGLILTLTIFLSVGGAPNVWAWSYILMAATHLAVVALAAGRVLGVDAALRRRVTGGSLISRLYRLSS